MLNGFLSGREGKMVEGRDDGLNQSVPHFFPTGKASGSHNAP